MDYKTAAKRILQESQYMSLSTCDGKTPWVAPIYYWMDDEYDLYFASPTDTLHAQHILKNPAVAVAIFDSRQPEGTGTGVQIEGRASLLDEKEYVKVLELRNKKKYPAEQERAKHPIDLAKYQGIKRIFKIVSLKFYMPDEDYWEKQHLDRRIEVPLKD